MKSIPVELKALLDGGPLAPVPNPYPLYARLRREAPVLDLAKPEAERRNWLVTRHDDVRDALRDEQTFSSRVNARQAGLVMGRTVIEMDGGEHLKHRNLITPALAPRALRGDFPKFVEQLANEIVDRFADAGTCDLVPDFTFLYPLRVFVEILGLPPDEVPRFHQLAVDMSMIAKDPGRAFEASKQLAAYLTPLVARRRADPADDLLSVLATVEVEGERMTDDEVVSFLRLLVSAGADTTYHLLGSMLAVLLRDPELLERLSGERQRIDDFVRETLRFETPVSTIPREALVDCELAGVPIRAGDDVLLHLGSANRDEEHYPEPDRFDLDRDTSDHLAFGIGKHFCAGSRLALLEARVGLEVVLDRLADLKLAPGRPAEVIGFAFRGPATLPVHFRAA
ncbi:MAG: cytochrome P450 [Myxococcota bacterium]|nr:cytochrome P450 [Myxococcota bacterium]